VQRLFAYIFKNNFVFLFILLEAVAFLLVIQNNYQKTTVFHSTNKITGSLLESYHNVSDYFYLKKANQSLVEENIALRKQLEESFRNIDTNYFVREDSLFAYIGARVVRNTINRQKNYLFINKGSDHGIYPDMGVITSEGVVGTVVEVSQNYSRIMSVLHSQNIINARIKKNRHLGKMAWDGKDYRFGELEDIPNHVKLFKGDTIVTSGNSFLFPEGVMIGVVENYQTEETEKFSHARVRYSVDFNNVYNVYVIVNLMQNELNNLEEE
jgi:rod shape-determining protein MreC